MTKSWKERIEEAKQKGEFTADDFFDAARWNRCAVGEIFGLQEFSNEDAYGKIWLPELIFLGKEFYRAVNGDRI